MNIKENIEKVQAAYEANTTERAWPFDGQYATDWHEIFKSLIIAGLPPGIYPIFEKGRGWPTFYLISPGIETKIVWSFATGHYGGGGEFRLDGVNPSLWKDGVVLYYAGVCRFVGKPYERTKHTFSCNTTQPI